MSRRHRSAVLAVVVAASAWALSATAARASSGPGCEAGAPCPDNDGDGFVACACAPPGVACDCDDDDPNAYPGAPERCDSPKDLNCDGIASGACGEKRGCLDGMCVMECPPLDDFGCGIGNGCIQQPNGQRLCQGRDCTIFGCVQGFTCDDAKHCVPDCTPDVRCPFDERCRGTTCVDPCANVACGGGSACRDGQCVAACDCFAGSSGCRPDEACDRTLPVPRCVAQSCAGVVCAAGSHCAGGSCVDDCAGVVCPPKLVCEVVANDGGVPRGECVDLCPAGKCALPMVCAWRTGACEAGAFREAGLQPLPPEAAPDLLFAGGAGVACTTNGLAGASATGGVAGVLWLAMLLARRALRRRP